MPLDEDAVKVIGSLRIGIAHYNVYLNEADEWSRCLLTELTQWSLEFPLPLGDTALGLVHSLCVSSAALGFFALAELAQALEQALVQRRLVATPAQVHLVVDAAEDIRRLLHQFAAGFLKQPDPGLLSSLRAMVQTG
ncbi:hypothetical protein GALL_551120 [mine drainage metagenome]|uniref:HPt domain-containing protein n=1 Tax=mine drainage metagenome TaxID=410659 RepID=A0A1J5P7B2_9ZZZZ